MITHTTEWIEMDVDDRDLYRIIGQRIREARTGRYSQKELGRLMGYSQAGWSKIELGDSRISLSDLRRVAELLGQPMSYFLAGLELASLKLDPKIVDIMTNLELSVVPVYGPISAGEPLFVMEQPSSYEQFPKSLLRDATFAVQVSGDSMLGIGIQDGDILLVRRQDFADHGDIVVACVDDGECTIKRLDRKGDRPVLVPANDKYEPLRPNGLRIIGKVVRIVRDL